MQYIHKIQKIILLLIFIFTINGTEIKADCASGEEAEFQREPSGTYIVRACEEGKQVRVIIEGERYGPAEEVYIPSTNDVENTDIRYEVIEDLDGDGVIGSSGDYDGVTPYATSYNNFGNGMLIYNPDTNKFISNIYKAILPIAVLISILRLMVYSLQMTNSKGDPGKLEEAKENIFSTIIGLCVIAGAVTGIRIMAKYIGL